MLKKAVSAGALLGALAYLSGSLPASADEVTTIRGNSPGIRCAAAAEAAAKTGTAGDEAILACKQAVGWAHFTPGEMGDALSNNGVLHLIQGDYQAAIADFDGALREGADRALALNDRGLAEAALHHAEAAAADYTAALSKAAGHRERIYFNRAMAEEDLGNLKAAYLDYEKASELAPHWEKAARELSRFTVAHPASV